MSPGVQVPGRAEFEIRRKTLPVDPTGTVSGTPNVAPVAAIVNSVTESLTSWTFKFANWSKKIKWFLVPVWLEYSPMSVFPVEFTSKNERGRLGFAGLMPARFVVGSQAIPGLRRPHW